MMVVRLQLRDTRAKGGPMLYFYDPDVPPSIFLGTHLESYEKEFREYWRLDESGREGDHVELYQALDEFAERVVHAARTLSDETSSQAALEEVWERAQGTHEEIATFLEHRLELAFSANAVEEAYRASQRAENLLSYLVRIENERARAYLHRVATCYLRGLETETLVMAGAVLEAAIEDACPDDVVRENVPNLQGKKYLSMQNRLDYLTTLDDVDYTVVERAGWLWDHRGSAVHQAPGLEAEIDEVLEALVVVLSGLEGIGERPA